MAEQRGYSPEELGLIPRAAEASRGYTPEELGLVPKAAGRGYTPEELGLVPKAAKPEPKPEDQSVLRQVADLPLQLGKGAVTGIRMIADAFGAGSDFSKSLKGGEDYIASLMSAQSKQDSQEIARIMKDAEDKGVLDQVKAGLKALSVAPIDTIVNALGTSAPVILSGLVTGGSAVPAIVGVGARAAIGAAMGAGTVKGTIYDAVKEELSKTDMPKDQIEARAKLAQDYKGQNLDMILMGMAVSTLGATSGVEPALAKNLAKGIVSKASQKETVDKVNDEATKLIAKRGVKKQAAITGAQELGTEFTQAGQEQFAENLALRREGYDVPLMRGVISNAVLEGVAGLGLGLGVGARTGYNAKQAVQAETRVKEELSNSLTQTFEDLGIAAPSKKEIDALIDEAITAKKEEIKNGTVAGTDKSSVPISTEQSEQAAAKGTGLSSVGNVDTAGQAAAGTGDGTAVQSDTLADIPSAIPSNIPSTRAITPEGQTKSAQYGEYYNGLIDAMNGVKVSSSIASPERLQDLIDNEVVQVGKGDVLQLSQKGRIIFNSLKDVKTTEDAEKVFSTFMPTVKPIESMEVQQVETPAAVQKTDEELQIEEDAREEEFRAKAESYIEQQPLGLAYQRIENGDFETKPKLKTFVNRLVKDGVLEDVEEILAAFSNREQTVDDILDMVREQLDEARETAINENIDEQQNEYDQLAAERFTPSVKEEVYDEAETDVAEEVGAEADTAAKDPQKLKDYWELMLEQNLEAEKGFLRDKYGVPTLDTLPEELQKNPNVQAYHDVFNEWLEATSNNDLESAKKLAGQASKLRAALPASHPSTEKSKRKFDTTSKKKKISPALSIVNDPPPEEAKKIQDATEGKTLYEVAAWLARNAPDSDQRYIAQRVADRIEQLEKLGSTFSFNVVHIGDTAPAKLTQSGVKGVTAYNFDLKTDKKTPVHEVYVKGADVTGDVGMSYETILHELVHTVTVNAYMIGSTSAAKGTDLAKTVAKMRDVSNAITDHFNARAVAGVSQLTEFETAVFARLNNALTDPYEIMSWSLTNRDMQEYLESIPYKNTGISVWSKLVQVVREFLKLPASKDTALSEVLSLTDEFLKTDTTTLKVASLLSQMNLMESRTNSEVDSPKLSSGSDILSQPMHPSVDAAVRNGDLRGALEALKNTGGAYFRGLAERLLSLNTNVDIGYDLQDTLIPKYLDSVNGQKDRILTYLSIVYPDVYAEHFNEGRMFLPLTELGAAFTKLKKGEFDVELAGFEEDLKDVTKTYAHAIDAYSAPGFYFNNTVSLNSKNTKYGNGVSSTQTFVHEVIHAFTHWAINHPNQLQPEQKKALDNLTKLYETALLNAPNPNMYGFKSLHEFVAEAFSRVKFQKVLREMKAGPETETKQSIWSKFMQIVYRILNTPTAEGKVYGKDNVLFHTLANTDILFSATKGYNTAGVDAPLLAPDKFNVKNGKIVVNDREAGFINSLIQNRRNFKNLNTNNFVSFLGTLGDQFRKYLLGGLTLDQLKDIVGEAMPYFKYYVKQVDAMHNTRNKILLDSEISYKNWSHLLDNNPEKGKQLGTAMIEATFAKLDPDPTSPGYDESKFKFTKQGQRALAAWKEMAAGKDGDIAIKVYRDVRKFYETRMEEYISIELDRLEQREKANNTLPQEIAKRKAARRAVLEADIIKPYFPIKRFGEFWIQIGKGADKIFLQFENAAARNQVLQETYNTLINTIDPTTGLKYTNDDILEVGGKVRLDAGNQFSVQMSQKLSDYAQLTKLHDLIDATSEKVSVGGAVDKVVALRDALNDNVDQLYLEIMPSESIKKMFIHRKNIAGPSQDMLRAFAVSRQRIAYQRARFQHLPEFFRIVEGANKYLAFMPIEERTKWNDYVRELELNLKTGIIEPPKQSKLTTFFTQFGFLNFLTAPASAIVNIMAVPGIYMPAAIPKYGAANVATSLGKYNRMLGGTGVVDERTGRYEFLSLARANLKNVDFAGTEAENVKLPLGKTLEDVYQEGIARSVIDVTLSHDAASLGEQPSEQYTGRWQKIMYYASLPFHAAEKYNRETTFMASFDMAYRKYLDKTDKQGNKLYTKEKAYEAALDDARDLVQSTMFNYNTVNKPRYFRGDFRNVILQFKMYPQHMSVLMFRTFQKGWRDSMDAELKKFKKQLEYDKTPADEQIRLIAEKTAALEQIGKEAREQFVGMMGMSFLFGGASGLPLFFIFEGVAKAFHAVFGDDDEPFDVNNWFKNWCNRTFGGFVGDTISRGLLSQATGLNFADRMSVNITDMWFPDIKKSNDEVQYMQNAFTNLLGPTAGALLNYGEALKRYNDGHTERAFEAMMPAAIKNVMVGTRYMMEGKALTLRGAEVDSYISPAEAVAQMIGFSPEDTAQKQKASFEMKNANEQIMSRRTDLLNAFFIAIDGGDSDMLDKVLEKIQTFSITNPGASIDGRNLIDSVNKRYEDRALSNITGGMGINKKLIPQLMPMLDYSQ